MPLTADNDNLRPGKRPRCPTCGKTSVPEFRPFCSDRCKDVDLAYWLAGSYAIPCHNMDADSHDTDVADGIQQQTAGGAGLRNTTD